MNILVVNAGSTTIKYKHISFNADNTHKELQSGLIDNRDNKWIFKLQKDNKDHRWEIGKEGFQNASKLVLKEIKKHKIDKIGFRIVHGSDIFTKPTKLTSNVIAKIDQISNLAPLHNPPALQRIKEFGKLLKGIPMYGVFDTSFHSTIPKKAFLYALPYKYYKQHKIRKYGFHGTSHKYISQRFLALEPNTDKIISCHLGGGASITAVENGKSIETSMGFTPLEGLIMATRPGDVDDGVIHYMLDKLRLSSKEIQHIENKMSGLLGVSEITSDMRHLLKLEADGNKRAHLTIEMYLHRIKKYIGMYTAILGGVNGLIFTGGVGQGSDIIRRRICEGLDFLNLHVDPSLNDGKYNVDYELKISTSTSVPIWIIPTNEELQIAKEIMGL